MKEGMKAWNEAIGVSIGVSIGVLNWCAFQDEKANMADTARCVRPQANTVKFNISGWEE